ncbi:MAG: helix-hairpin-helix domain-containing protein [Clostridium sp.]|nr:helix-hairpin-helix domain-containing protein [Clostridium sp.]
MIDNRIFIIGMIACMLCGCSNGEVRMTVKEEAVSEEADFGSVEGTEQSAKTGEDGKTETGSIYVYVCGHVVNPGVYALDEQARICDAIALAGGISEHGRGEALNQAERMTDGQTVYVPGMDEEWSTQDTDAAGQADGKVNINTASKEELMTLPGIGEAKAETIIQYREEHGGFDSIEGLMDIPGIKEGVYNKLKEKIKAS